MLSKALLPSRIRSIVVLRALPGIGDHLCAIPALRALRAGLPRAHVAVLSVDGAEAVLTRFPEYVDELIPFAGFPGIPEKAFDPAALPAFYQRMVDREFDVAIQMQGNGRLTNSLIVMLGARFSAGFHLPGFYRPGGGFIEYPERLPETRRHLALMESLGFPSRGDHVSFPLTEDDRAQAAAVLAAAATADAPAGGGGYVCVHPGAATETRRWSPESFAAVGDALAREGFTVFFTGMARERHLVSGIQRRMAQRSVNLAGLTGIGVLAALLEGAALVVCNDTGVSHVAAAMRTPSVVIFAGTLADGSDPLRWAPLDHELHRVVARDAGSERHGHGSGLRGGAGRQAGGGAMRPGDPPPVSIPRVLQAVDEQLDRYGRRRTRGAPGGRLVLETADVA